MGASTDLPTKEQQQMHRRSRIAAAFAATALAGAGVGAAAYDAASGSPATATATKVVAAAPVANATGALSVNTIYNDSIGSVVEIQATTSGTSGGQTFPYGGPGGGSGASVAQGTGFV